MKYAIIGFGEAGAAICADWPAEALAATRGFDLKSLDPANGMTTRYKTANVSEAMSAAEAVAEADVIFSLVTADQATKAAESARGLNQGALYLECNSVSPGVKRQNAEIIEAAGGRFVDVAVMAPVHPAKTRVPLLLSGPHMAAAAAALTALGMNAEMVEGALGRASAIKMVRSIMIKGLEAVAAECALAGVAADVDEFVIPTLEETFPGFGWEDRIAFKLERMMTHGGRRAAEMVEVAKTIDELGLPSRMSASSVDWHRDIGAMGLKADSEDYRVLARQILGAMKA